MRRALGAITSSGSEMRRSETGNACPNDFILYFKRIFKAAIIWRSAAAPGPLSERQMNGVVITRSR
jgi:hypothetical protein